MPAIIECIPNFSEGRCPEILDALRDTAQGIPGVQLWDFSADVSHNRSVYTLAGNPSGIAEAAFRMCQTAAGLIDLSRHSGEHPRMGATDVIPFVPVRGVSMEECVEISRRVARRIGEELGIPCLLYEESATAPHRKNLADVRRGGFEGLAKKLEEEGWAPDFGPHYPHPTAGATAIGARGILVAFNINLNTPDIAIARDIARTVRASNGGFACCKAIGVLLEDRGIAQVSMNFTNYQITPLWQVFDAVRTEAEKRGAGILSSELIGLAPAQAFADCAAHYWQLENYDAKTQVLESHLEGLL